jgi:hypothetical protein
MNDEAKLEQLRKAIVVSGEHDFLRILEDAKGVLKIDSVAGPVVSTVKGITDKDRVLFYLFGVKAGKVLGLESMATGTATIDEMASKLGIPHGTLRKYLSILSKEMKVSNIVKGGKGKKAAYAVTDFGADYVKSDVLPRLKGGSTGK